MIPTPAVEITMSASDFFGATNAYMGEVFGPVAMIGIFITFGIGIAGIAARNIRAVLKDEPPPRVIQQPEPQRPVVEIDWSKWADRFWTVVYRLMGWGEYTPGEKRKNDDVDALEKPKRDERVWVGDDGELVQASDFETPEGLREWLASRGLLEDER